VFNAIHLDSDHWNNLDAKHRNWSEYNSNSEQMWQREALTKTIIENIKIEIFPGLTSRQQQVIQLYFIYQLRQVQIAKILRISQPTVSQHISGKKRNGKKIGGSIHKIRKTILKKSLCRHTSSSNPAYMSVLQKLLDEKISLRNKTLLFKNLKI
jgi:predicted transcriptional regulator